MIWYLAHSLSLHISCAGSAPPLHLQPQHPSFTNISVAQGLSNGTVNALIRDRTGYVWFGTLDGLCRYDGYEVEVFKHNPQDSNSVADNTVAVGAMLVDRSGRLWIGTYGGGLDRFDPVSGHFIHYRHDPADPASLCNNSVRALLEDRAGTLWVGTFGGGLDHMVRDDGRFEHFTSDSADPRSLSEDLVRCLCEDRSGAIWVGTKSRGIARLDPNRKIFTRFVNDPGDPGTITAGEVWSIVQDASSTIWVGTDNGLNAFHPSTGKFQRFLHRDGNPASLTNNFVMALCMDSLHNLWIGSYGGGLDRYSPATGGFIHVRHDPERSFSLSSNLIRSLLVEGDGTPGARPALWIGTDGAGVDRENTQKKLFATYRNKPEAPHSLSQGIVYAFCVDRRGALWVGTSTALCRLDGITQGRAQFTRYRRTSTGANSLSSNFITSILESASSELWIGTWGGGIDVLDGSRRVFTHHREHPGTPGSLSNNSINVIYEDRAGVIWIGTPTGLERYDRGSGRFVLSMNDSSSPGAVIQNQVRAILEDREGSLWVGTDGGLKKLDRSTGGLVRQTVRNRSRYSDDRVYSLYEDGDGILWVGTSNGLDRFNRSRDSVSRFDAANGLVSTYVRGVIGDERGMLWLATTKGLIRLNPRTGVFHRYDAGDGLQGNEFSGGMYRTPRGEILLGGLNGFNAFDPAEIVDNEHVPPVVLTGFSIFEKPADLGRPVGTIGKIILAFNEDFFSFGFAALDYTNPSRNAYAYKLDGFDLDWVNAGNRRFAYYTNVGPGEYTFRVKGSNDDGVWNEAGASVQVIVKPPYWQTWWFRSLAAAALLGLLTILYNYRVSKLLEMERMRNRISSDLHDDIGSNLSSIALLTDMVRNTLPDGVQERQQLSDVSRAARQTADALKDIVWLIHPEHDKLDDIALRMKDTAAKLLTGVAYVFHCPDNAMTSVLDMEFRRNVLMIFKESLHNIAKYARATRVDITIAEGQKTLMLTITDNGIGFDEAAIRHGNGLNNLRSRARKLGGTMAIRSTPGRGTTIELFARIP